MRKTIFGRSPAARPAKLPARLPAVKLLLIGINYVGTESELRGCVTDIGTAKAWFAAKVDPKRFDLKVYELADSRVPGGSAVVQGAQGTGTRANILGGIEWLVAGARAGDVLYVHYSGHGAAFATASLGEVDGVDSAWVPLDYARSGCIADNTLRQVLVNRVPAGVRLWVTSDSCHSGTVLDLRFVLTDQSKEAREQVAGAPEPWVPTAPAPGGKALLPYDCRQLIPATLAVENRACARTLGTVFLLSGCKDLQTAADAYEAGKNQGALTWAMFSCVAQNAKAPLSYLLKDICGLLRVHGYDQIPQLSVGASPYVSQPFQTALGL